MSLKDAERDNDDLFCGEGWHVSPLLLTGAGFVRNWVYPTELEPWKQKAIAALCEVSEDRARPQETHWAAAMHQVYFATGKSTGGKEA